MFRVLALAACLFSGAEAFVGPASAVSISAVRAQPAVTMFSGSKKAAPKAAPKKVAAKKAAPKPAPKAKPSGKAYTGMLTKSKAADCFLNRQYSPVKSARGLYP